MTCIAGIQENGYVIIGGDSAGVGGWDLTIRADAKVFRRDPFVMGFTTSFRMGQLLRYALALPWDSPPFTEERRAEAIAEAGKDPFRFMATTFVDSVRKCLKDGGYAAKEKEREEAGQFLVGFAGKLFMLDSDYQVANAASGMMAVGCGAQAALGSLYTTRLNGLRGEARVEVALQAAEALSAGVRGPFHIIASCEAPHMAMPPPSHAGMPWE